MMAQDEVELKLYTLYLASQNTSAGGDGYITTEVPDSGGQDSAAGERTGGGGLGGHDGREIGCQCSHRRVAA